MSQLTYRNVFLPLVCSKMENNFDAVAAVNVLSMCTLIILANMSEVRGMKAENP